MYPAPNSHGGMGNFIAWDASKGKIVWSKPERFSVWSGALTTAGDVAFYGTLEGYLKAVNIKDGKELWKFKTPSGIIGNVFTYEYDGKQYVGTYSGIGGWAGIGMAAGLTGNTEGLGAVGGYKELAKYTTLGWLAVRLRAAGKRECSCRKLRRTDSLRPPRTAARHRLDGGQRGRRRSGSAGGSACGCSLHGRRWQQGRPENAGWLEDLACARLRALSRRRAGRHGRAVAGREAPDAEERGIPRADDRMADPRRACHPSAAARW